ncbi:MAG: hypothetical protein JXR83_10475 [Deltaproteobacteria bacterium]|nr:hypothetical protein [Deltaproteobacteria bacterium]
MEKRLGLALALAALLPFGCKCLSSEQSPPEEQIAPYPGGLHGPQKIDPAHRRTLDPSKTRAFRFQDRLRLATARPMAPLGSGMRPPGARPESRPASQPSTQAASQPASAPAVDPLARPGKTR